MLGEFFLMNSSSVRSLPRTAPSRMTWRTSAVYSNPQNSYTKALLSAAPGRHMEFLQSS